MCAAEEEEDEEDEDTGELDARRVEELRIRRLLKQYDEDLIGELDPDDPEVRGDGFNEDLLEGAMDEFLKERARADADAVVVRWRGLAVLCPGPVV